eukprot:CAMPEP_0196575470 /NCGR_PEP_ID=MMETSP1081-20130531/4946_1 /TAXON_ID=36882 /ORGANISM="Pyramimonas amylifera, Strain CCMP720" /LENGTH=252 /DNA_ID=CAMNT_0041893785 /DNA_START=20 /DNA_END=778 /DNA_ORIENTATION=+
MKENMTKHLDSLQQQMDKLKYHEDTVSMLSNPMEIGKYLESQGVSQPDIERAIMNGDMGVMQKMLEKQLGISMPTQTEELQDNLQKIEDLADALRVGTDEGKTSRKNINQEKGSNFSFSSTSKADQLKSTQPRPLCKQPRLPPPATLEPSKASNSSRTPEATSSDSDSIPVHRMEVVGSNLVINIELPGLSGMKDVVLEVEDTEVNFESTGTPKYSFRIPFQNRVDSEKAVAKFSKKTQTLKLTIELKNKQY